MEEEKKSLFVPGDAVTVWGKAYLKKLQEFKGDNSVFVAQLGADIEFMEKLEKMSIDRGPTESAGCYKVNWFPHTEPTFNSFAQDNDVNKVFAPEIASQMKLFRDQYGISDTDPVVLAGYSKWHEEKWFTSEYFCMHAGSKYDVFRENMRHMRTKISIVGSKPLGGYVMKYSRSICLFYSYEKTNPNPMTLDRSLRNIFKFQLLSDSVHALKNGKVESGAYTSHKPMFGDTFDCHVDENGRCVSKKVEFPKKGKYIEPIGSEYYSRALSENERDIGTVDYYEIQQPGDTYVDEEWYDVKDDIQHFASEGEVVDTKYNSDGSFEWHLEFDDADDHTCVLSEANDTTCEEVD